MTSATRLMLVVALVLAFIFTNGATISQSSDLMCEDPRWKIRTCCKNQMKYIDPYKGGFLAYVCSYMDFAQLSSEGGFQCVESVDICCNKQEGFVAPIRGGFQHSEPKDFKCQGLSGLIEDASL